MKKSFMLFTLIAFIIVSVPKAFGITEEESNRILYGGKHMNQYYQIQYWANVSISIDDYDYNSGDAVYLKLAMKESDSYTTKTNDDLSKHFMSEFNSRLKGKKPFHNVNIGFKDRFNKFFQQHGKEKDFLTKYEAYEEARRTSLYGEKPGVIYCSIKIKRREFPILYVIATSISAEKNLRVWSYSEMKEEDIGFSAPEYIIDELKRAISTHTRKLAEKMHKINKYQNE